MTWLTEDPSPLLYLTIAIQLALLVALMHTRRVAVIGIMGMVLLMLGAAYVVDMLVVTQHEEVADVLDEMVTAAVAGDKDELLSHVGQEAKELRHRINYFFRAVTLERASVISGPEIVFNDLTIPPSAIARFKVHARGKTMLGSGPYTGAFTIRFDQVDGRWLATFSEDDSPY